MTDPSDTDRLPDPREDPTGFVTAAMPLCSTLGVEAVELTPERVVLELAWRRDLCTLGGALHGGTIMAVADSAGATCAFLHLPPDALGTTTVTSTTSFLRGVTDGSIVATATPLHVGGTTIVVETEVRCDERIVAKVTQTQAVLRPRA